MELLGPSEGHALANRVVDMGMRMDMIAPYNALLESVVAAASLRMLLLHPSTCSLAVLAALLWYREGFWCRQRDSIRCPAASSWPGSNRSTPASLDPRNPAAFGFFLRWHPVLVWGSELAERHPRA